MEVHELLTVSYTSTWLLLQCTPPRKKRDFPTAVHVCRARLVHIRFPSACKATHGGRPAIRKLGAVNAEWEVKKDGEKKKISQKKMYMYFESLEERHLSNETRNKNSSFLSPKNVVCFNVPLAHVSSCSQVVHLLHLSSVALAELSLESPTYATGEQFPEAFRHCLLKLREAPNAIVEGQGQQTEGPEGWLQNFQRRVPHNQKDPACSLRFVGVIGKRVKHGG